MHLLQGTDRTVDTLMIALEKELTLTSTVPGKFKGRVSVEALKNAIADSVDSDAPSDTLHATIAYAGEAGQRHHFLAVWYVGDTAPLKVD